MSITKEIRRVIKETMEQCSSCAASSTPTISANGGVGQSIGGRTNRETYPVTYDDGDGTRETIRLNGSLNDVFLRALNVTLRKQPLNEGYADNPNSIEGKDPVTTMPASADEKKETITTEGYFNHESTAFKALAEDQYLPEQDVEAINNSFNFNTGNQFTRRRPLMQVTPLTVSQAMDPQNIHLVNSVKVDERGEAENVLVVLPDDDSEAASGFKRSPGVMDLIPNSDYVSPSRDVEELVTLESMYPKAKVIYGTNNFLNHLVAKTKALGYA